MIRSAYIHIPFCEHICHYCDFNKFYLENQPVEEYLNALEKEMALTLSKFPTNQFETIFVGGGTPTALNEAQLTILCESINKTLSKSKKYEFTFEANPGDLSSEKLHVLKEAGVNRISLGVQSFNDDLLKKIGRSHKAKDVYTSIGKIKEAGFENISIDLIFSLPEQTMDDFKVTLNKAISLDLPHYSGYSLIIEPKTVFFNLLKKGKLPTPGEDVEAAMYEVLMEEMEKNGLKQYEISNFAKPGFESKHNLVYWNNEQYYGFGAGAHSYVNGNRCSNIGPLKKYMDEIKSGHLPVLEKHVVSRSEQMEEEMFLGLRKTEGVAIGKFTHKFGQHPLELFKNEIEELVIKGWIEVNAQNICLTKKGRLLGNEVFQSFLGIGND